MMNATELLKLLSAEQLTVLADDFFTRMIVSGSDEEPYVLEACYALCDELEERGMLRYEVTCGAIQVFFNRHMVQNGLSAGNFWRYDDVYTFAN